MTLSPEWLRATCEARQKVYCWRGADVLPLSGGGVVGGAAGRQAAQGRLRITCLTCRAIIRGFFVCRTVETDVNRKAEGEKLLFFSCRQE